MRHYWLSTSRMTFCAGVEDGLVRESAPIARRFVGQPAANLRRWLVRQGGFRWAELTPYEPGTEQQPGQQPPAEGEPDTDRDDDAQSNQ